MVASSKSVPVGLLHAKGLTLVGKRCVEAGCGATMAIVAHGARMFGQNQKNTRVRTLGAMYCCAAGVSKLACSSSLMCMAASDAAAVGVHVLLLQQWAPYVAGAAR